MKYQNLFHLRRQFLVRRGFNAVLLSILLLSAACTRAEAQGFVIPATQMASSAITQKTIPDDVLYWHFLLYDQRLQQRAEERGAKGKWLSTYLEGKIGLSDAQMQIVHQAGTDLTTQITPLKQEALTITQDARTARLSGETMPAHDPTTKERLHELALQKHQYVVAAISRLNSSLGTEGAAKLSSYVRGDFAQGVSQVSLSALHASITAKKAMESGEPAK